MMHFGPFTFEPTSGSLWRGGALLPLLPKDAAVLAVLVHHAGQIVSKARLLDAVWPETYVTETVLKNCIARLRRLLGDDLKTPRYIETRARRGYRFLGTGAPPAPQEAVHAPTSAVVQPLAPMPLVPSGMVGASPSWPCSTSAWRSRSAGSARWSGSPGKRGLARQRCLRRLWPR